MKGFIVLISIGIAVLTWISGCSREEENPPPVKRPKIVKPIIKPPPEVIKHPVPDKAPQPQSMAERVSVTDSQEIKEERVEQQAPVVQKTAAKPVKEPSIYVVKKGESLSSISGRENVYGNSSNWPILYRHNLDKLAGEEIEDDLPDKIIREGVRLRVLTQEELRKNLEERADQFWVINIVSATNAKEVVAPAIKLIKGGYFVYITSAEVKGESYQRLRVGFFKSRGEADVAGKKILALLNTTEFWPTKIEKNEHEAFAGY